MKQAGLALEDPMLTAPENWTASCIITGYLVAAIREHVELRTMDHLACLQEGRTAVRKRSAHWAEEALVATITGAPVQGARQLQRATNTGA